MNLFIRQLTGVRFIAAAWVVLYHFQIPLGVLGILAIPGVTDILRVGRLGVDLFFALSGFILTHTYLRRLGPALHIRGTLDFWWLRLARIYPVHLAMIFVAGLAVAAQARIAGGSLNRNWLNPVDLVKNLLLIQEWVLLPAVGGTSLRGRCRWNGWPTWPFRYWCSCCGDCNVVSAWRS